MYKSYKQEKIILENFIYNLNEKLNCNVVFENDSYIISNNLLDIVVWADTSDDAENAFCFTFSAIYLKIRQILKFLLIL